VKRRRSRKRLPFLRRVNDSNPANCVGIWLYKCHETQIAGQLDCPIGSHTLREKKAISKEVALFLCLQIKMVEVICTSTIFDNYGIYMSPYSENVVKSNIFACPAKSRCICQNSSCDIVSSSDIEGSISPAVLCQQRISSKLPSFSYVNQ